MDGDTIDLTPPLRTLASVLEDRPEALASSSQDISAAGLSAARYLFDFAVSSEEQSRSHIDSLLLSFNPTQAPQTRSQTRASGKRKREQSPPPAPKHSFEKTPIPSLFVDGLSDEQIWAQLELRTNHVWHTLHLALEGTGEGSSAELDVNGAQSLGEDEDDDLEAFEAGELGESEDEDEEEEDEDEEDESEEEEEDEEGDGEDMASDLGETITGLRGEENDSDDSDDLRALETPPQSSASFSAPRRRQNARGHKELDDGFFDLASFNAEIEEIEAKSVTRGSLAEDSDEDMEGDAIDFYADFDVQHASRDDAGEGDLMYKDFFAPPARVPGKGKQKPVQDAIVDRPRSNQVRFSEEVRVKKIKARGKNLPLSALEHNEEEDDDDEFEPEDGDDDDDEDDVLGDVEGLGSDDEEEEESDSNLDESDGMLESDEELGPHGTMERLQTDLFADDDEAEDNDLSTHQKRQAALREQIVALEDENVSKKDWTLMGEASSRSRPANSLLEEDLEFERVMKAVPVMTEDVVQGLEDRIKARILEGQFDDVVRRRPVDEKPFLPSRLLELQDTKSKQSLSQIYEDEYTAAQAGTSTDDRDGKLAREHEELEKLWDRISYKLDSLSNTHFTPKAPKAAITTVSNVASASMESALPTAKSAATMLAPEEVYQSLSSELRARSELTPAEKRALHNKQKKTRKMQRDSLERSVDKFAKAKGPKSVKAQKEAALKSVVKHGKGVTVVGKTANVSAKSGRKKT